MVQEIQGSLGSWDSEKEIQMLDQAFQIFSKTENLFLNQEGK